MKYSETIPVLSVYDRESARRLNLMMGYHPDTGELLGPEDESLARDLVDIFHYVRKEDHDLVRRNQKYQIWLSTFPQVFNGDIYRGESLERALWNFVLPRIVVHSIGYVYYPDEHADHWSVRKEVNRLISDFHQRMARSGRYRGGLSYIFPFPSTSYIAGQIDEKFGLTGKIKEGGGLSDISSGLLANAITDGNGRLLDGMTPRQFEELCAWCFRENGWTVRLTKKTHDGGKDVVAFKIDERGATATAYVEAKTKKSGGRCKAVGIGAVKAFIATVAADRVEQGYLVTNAYFSREAAEFNNRCIAMRPPVASVELINRTNLLARINSLAKRFDRVFEL